MKIEEILANNNIVTIFGEIDQAMASNTIKNILKCYFDNKEEKSLVIIINSPGGNVSDGLAILSAVKALPFDKVTTVALGQASSMGAVLLACAGTRGSRFALPYTEIMVHQPIAGIQGQITDLAIHTKQAVFRKRILAELLAEACNKTAADISKIAERDHFFSTREAVNYKLIDDEISSLKEVLGYDYI
ncbi:MAG: ATP-dependent Clp protease proteolytic subunit [Clostridia bacterium]|nr:ATP-dependent Clp protease proteolytic subunit [Clostridia bacterium]